MTATTKPQPFHEAQATLLQSQRGVIAPMPKPVDPVRRNRLVAWVVGAVVVVGAIAVARGVWGAERPGKYEITLLFAGKDYDNVSRTFRTIGEPYDSKTACEIAITRVRVMVSGARLRCDPVEMWRVQ